MSEQLSIIALIVASVSAAVAFIGLSLTWKKSKFEKLTHESQFISDIQHELTESDYQIVKIETKEDCALYVWSFLNTMDRLCYFDSKGYLTDEMIEYFRGYLEESKKFHAWLKSINELYYQDASKGWQYLQKTWKKHDIKESTMPLPGPLQMFSNLK